MKKDHLAFHETVDTHEILNLRTVVLLKAKLMQGIVFDQELRILMQKNVEATIIDIQQLKEIYPEKTVIGRNRDE